MDSLKCVEILHIDTVRSEELYSDFSPRQKSDAQEFLLNSFVAACKKFKGNVRDWAGDGGFAFFNSSKQCGNSVLSAEYFLNQLVYINAQTAKMANVSNFKRNVRITVHRGEIHIRNNSGLDSADPKDFDAFLKNEKKFAPYPNNLFITKELYGKLDTSEKNKFEHFKDITVRLLKTSIYRLKKIPREKVINVLAKGNELKSIRQEDWDYINKVIRMHKLNISARNTITRGLIENVHFGMKSNKRLITSSDLIELTLKALYHYLTVSTEEIQYRLSFWIPDFKNKNNLKMYPFRFPPIRGEKIDYRVVCLNDKVYKVCQAYNELRPIATPSVQAAYKEGSWAFFDGSQKREKRNMASALQLPVYSLLGIEKVGKGVLSLDSNMPDTFLNEEIEDWQEDLVHYLVNLALSIELLDKEH